MDNSSSGGGVRASIDIGVGDIDYSNVVVLIPKDVPLSRSQLDTFVDSMATSPANRVGLGITLVSYCSEGARRIGFS